MNEKSLTAVALLTLGMVFAIASPCTAQESPQHMASEFRFGLYQPSIDGEFPGSSGPYKTSFGDQSLWMFTGELDYQFWRPFGSLGAYGNAGFGWVTGHGIEADGTQSSDKTSMRMLPFDVGLVYRFDVLATRFKIPLVLALKGGLTYALWWITNGSGDASTWTDPSGTSYDAAGGTWGLRGAVALHLLLDIFEPHTAKVFDNELGVNHSYLFVEYGYRWLNDFGSDSSFDLSDDGFTFGLAFEM